ncbi:MAG: PilZ domain-containing protein [Desulfobacterales bacterium]
MNDNERRKYPRVDTSNLLECCCLDEDGSELDHYLVRALDVSPVGVKIESFQEIESETIRLAAIDSDGSLIEIKGRIVHSRKTEAGSYEIGVCFADTELENTRFALKLIRVCQRSEPAFVMVKGSENIKGDRRKYPRVNSDNLITYSCVDESNTELNQCMARALNVSPLGAKIETYQEILSENIHLTTVDDAGNLLEIMGRVVYAHKAESGRYEFGIVFTGTEAENTDFALKLIGVCHKIEPAFVMVKRSYP